MTMMNKGRAGRFAVAAAAATLVGPSALGATKGAPSLAAAFKIEPPPSSPPPSSRAAGLWQRVSSSPLPLHSEEGLGVRGGGPHGDGDGGAVVDDDDEEREVDALRHFERARSRLTGYVDPYQELYQRRDGGSGKGRSVETKDDEEACDAHPPEGEGRWICRDDEVDADDDAMEVEDGGDVGDGDGNGLLRIPCSLVVVTDSSPYRRLGSCGAAGGVGSDVDDGTPLLTYVDTGAQVTVLSSSAARRAGLLHLLDGRYAGRVTGVGHARVLGRIPAGSCAFVLGKGPSSSSGGEGRAIRLLCPQLTVLDDSGLCTRGVDLLLGLDVLSEWGAAICLREGVLRVSMPPSHRDGEEDAAIVVIAFVGQKSCRKDLAGGTRSAQERMAAQDLASGVNADPERDNRSLSLDDEDNATSSGKKTQSEDERDDPPEYDDEDDDDEEYGSGEDEGGQFDFAGM